jgi:hypothetical protein
MCANRVASQCRVWWNYLLKKFMQPNPQADSLIECGQPLKEMARLFPTKVEAYQYFASSMTRTWSSPDRHCCACGRACQEPPMRFTWRANLHTTKTVILSFLFTALALLAHHLYSRWIVVEFTTVHRMCLQCQRRRRIYVVFVAVLHKVLFAILILLLCLTVPAVVFLVAMPFLAPEGIRLFLPASIMGIGLIALVALGFEMCRRLLIPQPLRQVGRFPFFLCGLSKTP